MALTNEDARAAATLFQKKEGIDIHPASAVAVASLQQAAANGMIAADALIMLNITGGGEERYKAGHSLWYLKPALTFPVNPDPEEVKRQIGQLFGI